MSDSVPRELVLLVHASELVANAGLSCSQMADVPLTNVVQIRVVSSGALVFDLDVDEWARLADRPHWMFQTPPDANPRIRVITHRSSSSARPHVIANRSGIDLDGNGTTDVTFTAQSWSVEIHANGAGGVFDLLDSPTLADDSVEHELASSERMSKVADRGAVLIGPASGPRTIVNGSSGPDKITLGGGNDDVRGFAGADIISGGGGDDAIFGGAGADSLRGAAGNDALSGRTDSWEGSPSPGIDRSWGDAGSDVIRQSGYAWGGAGDDIVYYAPNLLDAGPGNDIVATWPNRSFTCGAGIDRAMVAPQQLKRFHCERTLSNNNDGDDFHSRWLPTGLGRAHWCPQRHTHALPYESCGATPPRDTVRHVRDRLPIISSAAVVGSPMVTAGPVRDKESASFESWERCDALVHSCVDVEGGLQSFVPTNVDAGSRIQARWRWADGGTATSAPSRIIESAGTLAPSLPRITLNAPSVASNFAISGAGLFSRIVNANWEGDADTHVERRTATPYAEPSAWSDDPPIPWNSTTSWIDRGDPGTTTCVRATDRTGRHDGTSQCTTLPLTARAFTNLHGWRLGRADTSYQGWHIATSTAGAWARTDRIRASRISVFTQACRQTCSSLQFRWNGRIVATRNPVDRTGLVPLKELPVVSFDTEQTGVLEVRVIGRGQNGVGGMVTALLVERNPGD